MREEIWTFKKLFIVKATVSSYSSWCLTSLLNTMEHKLLFQHKAEKVWNAVISSCWIHSMGSSTVVSLLSILECFCVIWVLQIAAIVLSIGPYTGEWPRKSHHSDKNIYMPMSPWFGFFPLLSLNLLFTTCALRWFWRCLQVFQWNLIS